MSINETIKKELRVLAEASRFENQDEIDSILDKIKAYGGHNHLSNRDKKILRSVADDKSFPELNKVAGWFMVRYPNPQKSRPTLKDDGTQIIGVRASTNHMPLAMLYYRRDTTIEVKVNKDVWDLAQTASDDASDAEMREGIAQWARKYLNPDIQEENVSRIGFVS